MNNLTKIKKALQEQGYLTQTVEAYNTFTQKRKDLFGIMDILAMKPGELLGVQSTTPLDHGSHATKYLNNPELTQTIELWLSTGSKFEIWTPEKDYFKVKVADIQTYPVRKLRFLDEKREKTVPDLTTLCHT